MGSTTELKRSLLRALAYDAANSDPPISLADGLAAAERGRINTTSRGRFVTVSIRNGNASHWELPQGYFSDQHFAEDVSTFVDLCDTARATLISGGIASPTDAQILVEMLDRLRKVTSFRTDHSGLRYRFPATVTEVAAV